MYILIAIVFIAELIIALNLILLIVKADKKVCEFCTCIEAFNPLVETFLQYARSLVFNFRACFDDILKFVNKKKEQMIFKTTLMIAIYILLIVFKLKTKKVTKIYKLVSAIRELAMDLLV